jgi:ribosomal protein L13
MCIPGRRGKHLPTYTPSMDMGAFVVVINAEKVQVSGTKFEDKTYFNHVNGRPGSYRNESFKDLQAVSGHAIMIHWGNFAYATLCMGDS